MTSPRWDKLAADLTAAGFTAKVDERPYSEIDRGRVRSGVSRSITVSVPGKGLVTVSDSWWHKNPEIWLGWEITAEDAESIVQGRPVHSKKRGEVVTAVRTAFARLAA